MEKRYISMMAVRNTGIEMPMLLTAMMILVGMLRGLIAE
jgi:hypothetical protein